MTYSPQQSLSTAWQKDPGQFLTPEALAKRWNMDARKLRQWRLTKKGPNVLKLGHHFLYRLEDVLAFEQQQLRQMSTR